jgi:hypothetical protein
MTGTSARPEPSPVDPTALPGATDAELNREIESVPGVTATAIEDGQLVHWNGYVRCSTCSAAPRPAANRQTCWSSRIWLPSGSTITTFAAMTMAEIDIAGPVDLEMRALDWLFTTWLPRSKYVPDHQPMFEAWIGEPFAHGHEHFEVHVQIAVVDAATPL